MIRKLLASLSIAAIFVASVVNAATVQLPGQGILFPGVYATNGPAPESGTTAGANLNGATIKFAAVGYLFQKDAAFQNGATKTIKSVSIATGNRTCAGCTSTVQVDVQTVGTSGPPAIPSGSLVAAGATVQVALSTSFTSSTLYTVPDFTTPPTVHYGDLVAFVFSFATYDSGATSMATNATLYDCGNSVQLLTFNGTTWTNGCTATPTIQINYGDGTTGTLMSSSPINAFSGPTNDTYASASNPNEIGLTLNFPIGVQVDQLCAGVGVASTSATLTLELTDNAGTPNVLGSAVIEPHGFRATGTGNLAMSCAPIAPVALTANTAYRVGVLATGAGNVTVPSSLVVAAATWDAGYNSGQNFVYTTRHNASWASATTTKRPDIGVMVSAFDIGNGPSSLLLNHAIP